MNPQNNSFSRRPLFETGVVSAFCAIFAVLAICFARSASLTSDETAHLSSGYTYLKWNDYRINPEHPPLVKKLAALPLLAHPLWPESVEPGEEDFSTSRFFTSQRLLHLSWAMAIKYPNAQWNFCHQFLYGVTEDAQHRYGAETPLLIPSTASLASSDFHNNADRLIFCGRLIVLLLGIALAIIVYVWARELHGVSAAGVLSIALFVFDPNFIAHSALVATDVPLALLITATVYFYWRLCRRLEIATIVFFLVAFALAFVVKFSAIVLVPIYWLIAIGRTFNPAPWPVGGNIEHIFTQSRAGKASLLIILFLGAATVTWATIWGLYDFRYSAAKDPQKTARDEEKVNRVFPNLIPLEFREPGFFPTEELVRRSSAIKSLLKKSPAGDIPEQTIKNELKTTRIGWGGQLLLFADQHRLLPESYLSGFATAETTSLLRPAYLRGEYSSVGFRSYFIWTVLLKTTLPALAAVVFGTYLAIVRKVRWTTDLAFLVIPVGVYFLFAVMSNMNIGHRHLLPVYPFLYVLAGLVGKELTSNVNPPRWNWYSMAGLVVIAISSSFAFYPPWRPQLVFPHYLAYFNELAGGPANGWRSLVDSNIDWGQDLKGLKIWLDQAGLKQPIYLCYFGTADPRYYGIQHRPVPKALGGYPPTAHESDSTEATREFLNSLHAGDHIAVSVQNLVGPNLSQPARQIWKRIFDQSTVLDRIGYSIFILRLNAKPQFSSQL